MATALETAPALRCPNEGCARPIGNRGNLSAHRRRCDPLGPEQRALDCERLARGLKLQPSGHRKRVKAWERFERRAPRLIDGEAWLALGPGWWGRWAREMRRELRRMGG